MPRGRGPIYLDFNSGAPLSAGAKAAIHSVLDSQASNPSSVHRFGRIAKRFLAESREAIAGSLGGVDPEQLVLTSSGSEANQWVIRSVLTRAIEQFANRGTGQPVWLRSAVEHDSVLQMGAWFESQGGSVREIPLRVTGEVDLSDETLNRVLDENVALASVIWVGNETGIIQDPTLITSHIHKRSLPTRIHLDAAQAWGKVPVNLPQVGADYVTLSGHKIGAPAGVGVLYLRPGAPLEALMPGKQEKGRRAGSENLLGAVALGGAARDLRMQPIPGRQMRDRFESLLLSSIEGTRIHGRDAERVWNTSNIGFEGVEGDSLVLALDLEGFAVSAGSACSSGALEPSHVLMAMGYSKSQAMAAIRVSFGRDTTWEELEAFVETLRTVVSRVRKARDE